MMRLRERDRIVYPQTIHSPTTTMSNDKVDQWMQAVAAMSSDKVDHAVPVRTHTPTHKQAAASSAPHWKTSLEDITIVNEEQGTTETYSYQIAHIPISIAR